MIRDYGISKYKELYPEWVEQNKKRYDNLEWSEIISKDYKNMIKYSFLKGFGKFISSIAIFSIPAVLASFPQWADITLGGVGILLVNYLKIKLKNV